MRHPRARQRTAHHRGRSPERDGDMARLQYRDAAALIELQVDVRKGEHAADRKQESARRERGAH